jgi:hypothetical protein
MIRIMLKKPHFFSKTRGNFFDFFRLLHEASTLTDTYGIGEACKGEIPLNPQIGLRPNRRPRRGLRIKPFSKVAVL